jgi:uncharacterized protein (DUF302 family)
MIKNLLALIGAIVIAGALVAYIQFGSMIKGAMNLDSGAMPAYMNMFTKVIETGDPAEAMMKDYVVAEDIESDEVKESIEALAEEYNMRVTGYVKMFTKEDAKPDEIKEARIWSLCSLHIAKVFLNHSRFFGGFMPCRIMLVEYGNGERHLVTMDLELAIHGGAPLPPEMLELAKKVQIAMDEIPARAANGDF